MRVEFRILEEGEIERIHENSLRVLHQVGFKVYSEELAQLLRARGIPVADGLVRLPPEVVMEALKVAPRHISLYSRKGDELPIQRGHLHPGTYSNAVRVYDYRASALRPSTKEDLRNFVRLGDAMPEVKIVSPACWPQDLPQRLQALHSVGTLMSNTTKHKRGSPHNLEEAEIWIDLASIASGSEDLSPRPTISFGLSPTSPLQLDGDTAQVLLHVVRKGLPLIVNSSPMAGGTSPFTLAGTLMLANAEHLFLLTAAQLIREGTPIIIGGAAGVMDMRTGGLSYGCPERHLILGAQIELADHYGLPHHSTSGSVDAWWPDLQSGAEKMLTWVTRLLKGVVLGLVFGSLCNGMAVSLEQMLIDADLLKMAQRVVQGFRVDHDTLALEAIERVGPGGNFLMDEHTLRWMRSGEHYYSDLVNRDGDRGGDMVERAHEKVLRILQEHRTEVPDERVEEIQRYVLEGSRLMAQHP